VDPAFSIKLRVRGVINLLFRLTFCGSVLFLAARSTVAGLPPNWRFVTPSPQGNDMLAAWAAAPDDLYVGGHGGVIQHWDGTNWAQMVTPTNKTIYAMHGLTTRDVWAVGGDAYTLNSTNHCWILHWNGTNWTQMTPPNYSGWTYPLTAVCAVGPKDVWATTGVGTFPVHYNGTNWQFVSVPLLLEGSLMAVTSVGTGHVFFAGTHGQIVHFQNGTWSLEQKLESGGFSANLLQALWGADLQNVYAGGNTGQVYRRNANGTWTDLGLGGNMFTGSSIQMISGSSATDLYFLGIQSIRHFNGTVINYTNDFSYSMRQQWMEGAAVGNRIYGVGLGGVAHEFVPNGLGGGTLSPLTAGGDATLSLTVNGATSCGTNGLLVYGSSLYRTGTMPMTYFDGFNYHDFPVLPPDMKTQTMVNAAWAGSLQDIVIAWDNMLTYERGVHHWNGLAWEAMGFSGNQPTDAIAFWRSPAGSLYACSSWRVMRWNGSNDWTTTYSVPASEMGVTVLSTIWGRSDSEIYIGAKNGKILRYGGAAWAADTTPGTSAITGISGNASDVYAVGENALVWRRVSGAWQKVTGVEQRDGDNFTQIVSAPDGVYAAQRTPGTYTGGGLGLLWRFNGATATLIVKGLSQPVDWLAVTGGHLYGISSGSSVITDFAAPAGFTQQRVNLTSTNWSVLGSSGVELRSPSVGAGQPMVVAWHVDQPSTFFSNSLPMVFGGSEHWIVRGDTFYAGSALPPMLVRFHYDPLKLPSGFKADAARLYQFDGKTWSEVPAMIDAVAKTITAQAAAGLGEWTFGSLRFSSLPALSVSRTGARQVLVSWPVAATSCQLESTAKLGPGTWSAVTNAPVLSNGVNQVILDAIGAAQFYRLRNLP
jgi:hypothetical protein